MFVVALSCTLRGPPQRSVAGSHLHRKCAFFGPSINQMPAVLHSTFFVSTPSRRNVRGRVAAIPLTACVYPTCLNVHFLGQA